MDLNGDEETRKRQPIRLVRRIRRPSRSSTPIPSKDPTEPNAEAQKQGHERAQREPVRIAVLRGEAVAADAVAQDAEERHVDDPRDEHDERRHEREDAHEDRADAVVGRAAEAEEDAEEGEACADGVQDEDAGEVEEGVGFEACVSVRWKILVSGLEIR